MYSNDFSSPRWLEIMNEWLVEIFGVGLAFVVDTSSENLRGSQSHSVSSFFLSPTHCTRFYTVSESEFLYHLLLCKLKYSHKRAKSVYKLDTYCWHYYYWALSSERSALLLYTVDTHIIFVKNSSRHLSQIVSPITSQFSLFDTIQIYKKNTENTFMENTKKEWM